MKLGFQIIFDGVEHCSTQKRIWCEPLRCLWHRFLVVHDFKNNVMTKNDEKRKSRKAYVLILVGRLLVESIAYARTHTNTWVGMFDEDIVFVDG